MITRVIGTTLLLFTATQGMAQNTSVLTVPITADLASLQALLEDNIDDPLHERNQGQRCVEPQRACTDIPEIHGFSVRMVQRCVDITPAIDCTISERVTRDGALSVSGSGGTLTFQQNIHGTATISGRGEIGRHIRETATGVASMTAQVTPRILPDWSIDPGLVVNYTWIQRPNVLLFNSIRVTFAGQADSELRNELLEFQTRSGPDLVNELELRSEVAQLWNALQEPHPIPVPTGAPLYLHVRPHAVGLDPFLVADGQLRTRASLSAVMQITGSPMTPFIGDRTTLPNLTDVPETGVSIQIPFRLEATTISSLAQVALPYTFEEPNLSASMTVSALTARIVEGRVHFDTETTLTALGVNFDGPLTVSAIPVWNAETQTLIFEDIEFEIPQGFTSPLVRWATNGFLNLFTRNVEVPLAEEIARIERAVGEELNQNLSPEIPLQGSLDLSVERLEVDGALFVELLADGQISLSALSLN